jgi:hypothetical protein
LARRGARSTGGARGGVGEAIPWPEVPVSVEALSVVSGPRGGETEVLLCDRGSAGKGTQRRGRMCDAWRRRGGRTTAPA